MIKNYLSLAIKNFRKQKLFSLINILGLSIGITCCLMLFLFIQNEFSYDHFHKNGKNIYRIMRVGELNGEQHEIPYVSVAYAPALINDFPDAIESAVRVMKDNNLISNNNISFNERNVFLADADFFNVFSFPLIKGDAASVLKDPNSIVLTESSAKKYFGTVDPMGKILQFNKNQALKVTGVCKDVPVNSHLQFDMVIPLEILRTTQPPEWFTNFPNNSLFTYIELKKGIDPKQLEKRFAGFMDKYLGKYYAESGHKMGLIAKPLNKIYFSSDQFDSVKHGNLKMVYIFMSIAVLILIIACINFVNLATARASDRSKEVGLRKVLGAVKKQLFGQFILESVLFATIACLISVGLLQLLMPAYNEVLGYKLPSFWTNPWFYGFMIGIIAVVGLLAGSYPALLLSSFSPIESLKGKLKIGNSGAFFRKALVVFQFGVSVLLIIGVVVVINQMKYVKNSDLGFNKEQSMIVRFDNRDIFNKGKQFKNELLTIPSVQSVSLMSGEPGGFHDSYSFEAEANPAEKFLLNTEFADLSFVKTLGLKIIAGRDLSESYGTDSLQAVLINRTAATKLGYTPEQAIGKWIKNISRDSVKRTIVGVVEDYHYVSLKTPIGPLVISPGSDNRLALIKLKSTNLKTVVENIKKVYADAAPAYPFEYSFLDERFDLLYRAEARQESVLSIFSIIAIFVACLGLFGLASYTAIKRTKEVGVRKVLGSSVQNIVLLLSKDLLKPVLLGALIAIPVGYYAMNKWLQSFAYRIEFHWWMFALAIGIAITIALLTVGIQAIKAAMANPVKSLRTE
ncbi:MAG: ABC transporter permease [Bacteroidetes bacterium]|nr:ABC transporter permease [Bacteroidota bacterium]MBS1930943.1 ABC transporter permease [Bacteroidota bacterium]